MRHSIRKNFTLIFIGLVAALLIIMYAVYSFFLQDYYRRRKIGTLESAYITIDHAVQSLENEEETLLGILNQEYGQNVEDSSITSIFRSLSERSSIDIVMYDDDGLMAATSRESEWNLMKLRAYIAFSEVYGDDADMMFPIRQLMAGNAAASPAGSRSHTGKNGTDSGQKAADGAFDGGNRSAAMTAQPIEVLKKTGNYTIQMFHDRRSNSDYLECWGSFSDGSTSFLMTMPIASIEEGTNISKQFLIGVSVLILVFGAVAVYFTTGLITRPINELAEISERMSGLDFSARYTGRQKNEIGVLGESMNAMSSRLEQAINDLREANARLQEDIDAKIKIDEMRKEFIADVSHELKTPISIIEGYAEGLVEGLAEDRESREYYCNVIMDESRKMNKMVRQLTSLISYEFDENANDRTVFDLAALIRSVTEAQQIRLNEAGAQVTVELPGFCDAALPDTDKKETDNRAERADILTASDGTEDRNGEQGGIAPVLADEFRIEEAFSNYLNNAIHHLDGEKHILIRLSDAGDFWRVSVYNDGTPIPEESLDKLWDKFYKVDKSRSRAYGGSGIGLSIVKAIIDAHAGTYGVENRPHGVEFSFTLPKHHAALSYKS